MRLPQSAEMMFDCGVRGRSWHHLVPPLADPGVEVVGEAGGAAEPVGVAVPAVVEGRAVVRVGEGAVQPGRVGGEEKEEESDECGGPALPTGVFHSQPPPPANVAGFF